MSDGYRSDELHEWEFPEPDEGDDDDSELIGCPDCGAEIYEDSPRCPVCGSYFLADTSIWSGRPLWWIVLAAIGVATLIGLLILGR